MPTAKKQKKPVAGTPGNLLPVIPEAVLEHFAPERPMTAEAVQTALNRNGATGKTVLTEDELDAFKAGDWGKRFPTVVATWRRAWDRVVPCFAFAPEVRRVIYTTDEIDKPLDRLIVSCRSVIRPLLQSHGHDRLAHRISGTPELFLTPCF